jgi:hypothetical protein
MAEDISSLQGIFSEGGILWWLNYTSFSKIMGVDGNPQVKRFFT